MSLLDINEFLKYYTKMTPDYQHTRNQLIRLVHQSLPEHLQRLAWSPAQLKTFQLKQLRKILHHAKNHSPWYRDSLKNMDPEHLTLSDLKKLPILDKQTVMSHWDEIVTVPGLTKAIAEAHLEQLREGKKTNPYFNDQYLFIATGGSSGNRGLFIWDLDFLKETACINYRFLIHDELKSNYRGPQKMAAIEAPTLLHGSQHLFTINVTPHITVESLNVVEPLEESCKILSKLQPNYLVGFAQYIAHLAQAQLQGQLHIQPRWVSTNSEPLEPAMRKMIQQAWGIQPCNSWGSVEIGSVAMENNDHNGMVIAEDGVLLEMVDDDFNPVNTVKDARKTLATSLFNFSMPLVRYVIEDILDITDNNASLPTYRVIKSVVGRATDWFKYAECEVPPIAFRDILSLSKEVDEYQVIQTLDGATIKLVCNASPNIETIYQKILDNLRQAGLKNPEITIEVVNTLPKHPETGKVKRFIALSK